MKMMMRVRLSRQIKCADIVVIGLAKPKFTDVPTRTDSAVMIDRGISSILNCVVFLSFTLSFGLLLLIRELQ